MEYEGRIMAIETYGNMPAPDPSIHGDLITPARGSSGDPKFWKWLMKLDIVYDDLLRWGYGTAGQDTRMGIVEATGWSCWVDFYLDECSPIEAAKEDLSYAD